MFSFRFVFLFLIGIYQFINLKTSKLWHQEHRVEL
jgi:hypothetical protein